MKTEQLISEFLFQNGNVNADLSMIDNGETITLVLEGITTGQFEKPEDYDEYVKSLEI